MTPETIYENWRRQAMEWWQYTDQMPPPHWSDLSNERRTEWTQMVEHARTEPKVLSYQLWEVNSHAVQQE